MNNISDKLKEIFQNFHWIDNIPEDQFRRDEICMQAKAALLLEANCTSERFPAFIRNAQKSYDEKCYNLPEPVILNHEFKDDSGNTITASITVNTFEIGNINADGKPWGGVYCPALLNKSRKEIQCNVTYSHQPCVWSVNEKSDLLFDLEQDIKECFFSEYPNLYSVCKHLSPYRTPEQMCRYWEKEPVPFGKLKFRNIHFDHIWSEDILVRDEENNHWHEARLEQHAFQFLIPCQGSF